jgi:Protein of unknown function (DUF4238)
MTRHHIVQDKYLTQWRKGDTENQLNIYVIPENKIIERGPGWKGFWREDFNVLLNDEGKSYLPEDVTAIIDTKGIEAIKKIDCSNESQLSGEDRSAIAFYVALQYIRTPRHREELDKMVKAQIQHLMRKDISSPDKVGLSKEDILKDPPKNKWEEEMIKQASLMSDEEIKKQVFEAIHSNEYIDGLTTTGHSKSILKVDKLSKELFEVKWVFLIAPKGASFITSDNPCFTISPTKIMNGLLSPRSTVIFPLRPDVCIYIKPISKTKTEHFLKLDKNQVRSINKLILTNSYQCSIAKDKIHLENLIKGYDYKNHRKSRDTKVSEIGDYTMFNIE